MMPRITSASLVGVRAFASCFCFCFCCCCILCCVSLAPDAHVLLSHLPPPKPPCVARLLQPEAFFNTLNEFIKAFEHAVRCEKEEVKRAARRSSSIAGTIKNRKASKLEAAGKAAALERGRRNTVAVSSLPGSRSGSMDDETSNPSGGTSSAGSKGKHGGEEGGTQN